jgi:hypothetical protein
MDNLSEMLGMDFTEALLRRMKEPSTPTGKRGSALNKSSTPRDVSPNNRSLFTRIKTEAPPRFRFVCNLKKLEYGNGEVQAMLMEIVNIKKNMGKDRKHQRQGKTDKSKSPKGGRNGDGRDQANRSVHSPTHNRKGAPRYSVAAGAKETASNFRSIFRDSNDNDTPNTEQDFEGQDFPSSKLN